MVSLLVQCLAVDCNVLSSSERFSIDFQLFKVDFRAKTFHSAEEPCSRWKNLALGEETLQRAKEPCSRSKNIALGEETLQRSKEPCSR